MRSILALATLVCVSATPALAQSLKPQSPAPLRPGINTATVDNIIGTHYWYFVGGPGVIHLHAQFTPMGLLGNASRSSITITLSDELHTWATPKTLVSDRQEVDTQFDGNLKTPTKVIVTVAPPPSGLVKSGGTYKLELTGPITYGAESSADPIIGMYKQMAGYTSLLGDCKFAADGTVTCTNGPSGHWKLFDKDTQTYVIDIEGQDRHSLQYHAGRGLCDGEIVLFQQI